MKKIIGCCVILLLMCGFSYAKTSKPQMNRTPISSSITSKKASNTTGLCTKSGCYQFADHAILVLKKQLTIGSTTGTTGLAKPTFDSIALESSSCKKEKQKLDAELDSRYKLYTDKVAEYISKGSSEQSAKAGAKPYLDSYNTRKKKNYVPANLCRNYKIAHAFGIEKTLRQKLADYEKAVGKSDKFVLIGSGFQVLRQNCNTGAISSIETKLVKALQASDRKIVQQYAQELDTQVEQCIANVSSNNFIKTLEFQRVIELMRARILFLKGYIVLSKGLANGQINPDLDSAKAKLEIIVKQGDPVTLTRATRLYSFVKLGLIE